MVANGAMDVISSQKFVVLVMNLSQNPHRILTGMRVSHAGRTDAYDQDIGTHDPMEITNL